MNNFYFKRIVVMFSVISALFTFSIYRVASSGRKMYSLTGMSNGFRTLSVSRQRAGIYDCHGEKITCNDSVKISAIRPSAQVYTELSEILNETQLGEIESSLKKGFPLCVKVGRAPISEDAVTFEVPVRYNGIASHLTGYTDSVGKGLCGLEKSFDGFLNDNSGEITVRYRVDASGKVLGTDKSISDTLTDSNAGVYLTIDKNIQLAAEYAMDETGIDSGAAVVVEVATGEIKALVSRPDYNPDRVGEFLSAENSPLLNKALCAYAAGSVFKPFVAVAGIEEGIPDGFHCQCRGQYCVGDTGFSCYGKTSHGRTDLQSALTASCNIFFINYSAKIDRESLISLCRQVGFGEKTVLCTDIAGEAGVLPTLSDLSNPGDYANFSFGQGKFTVTPVQLAAAYAAIVSDGVYKPPTLVKGLLDKNGVYTEFKGNERTRVISEKTAIRIRNMLTFVTENGCTSAKPFFTDAGGKTGTAQSGIFENGKEVCRTWYAGFFPADEPEYVAVILRENGTSGSRDCAPVFRLLADEIMKDK